MDEPCEFSSDYLLWICALWSFFRKDKKMYFVISNSDGDTTVEHLEAETLKQRLAVNYYGDIDFKSDISDPSDTNYWGRDILIIKGDIVVPQAVQTITEYKL